MIDKVSDSLFERTSQVAGPPPALPLIPVYSPDLSGNERRYVLECLDSGWISSLGTFVERFECAVADAIGCGYAVAVCNGTAALHLALHCLGIGPGDEVVVPSFTYIASVNAVSQTGAKPIFADIRPADWLLDPASVERTITPRTRAIMAVHLFGAVCSMPDLEAIAERHGLVVLEDAAESLGATLSGKQSGTFGRVGTFSFFGNKTITTGEGGMVITADEALAVWIRQARGQGQSFSRRYWHDIMGFNYRMTNIAAAIGLAQIERLPQILARKRAIAAYYREFLEPLPITLQKPERNVDSSAWLMSLLLPSGCDRERLMSDMAARSVETRPVFYCAHQMPVHACDQQLPISQDVSARGISLPSYPGLTEAELARVVEALSAALRLQGWGA